MIEFVRMFGKMRDYRQYEWEEIGRFDGGRRFAVFGLDKHGKRCKVGEFTCDYKDIKVGEDVEEVCKRKVDRAIYRMNHPRFGK